MFATLAIGDETLEVCEVRTGLQLNPDGTELYLYRVVPSREQRRSFALSVRERSWYLAGYAKVRIYTPN